MCRVQSLRNDHSYKNASSLSVGRLLVRLEELHVIRTLCMPSVKTKTWHSLNKPERLQASEPSYEKVSKENETIIVLRKRKKKKRKRKRKKHKKQGRGEATRKRKAACSSPWSGHGG
ncbi:hypothetical protein D8B26_006415 [Coccidioides posadasii str. Silveira]|uniref:uncharacterized protein n=1 Tax=Coccidioides posadasii (strain RMSCC 757 / Silveira) TaxID=443226 RepID=UPI001BEEA4F6|nr:hypothetical protein D8B26_006415 [Coccidioides posadasii str. Silveira]